MLNQSGHPFDSMQVKNILRIGRQDNIFYYDQIGKIYYYWKKD